MSFGGYDSHAPEAHLRVSSTQRRARPAPGHKSRRVAKLATIPRARAVSLLKAEHPDWSLLKIGETCQRRWEQLGDEAKAPYVELAQADAKRYKAEAAAYLAKM